MKAFSAVVLFLIVCVVLHPGMGGDYLLLDDDEYISENPFVRGGVSWEGIRWAFLSTHSGHWHPLTWFSLMMDCTFFGESSDASRLANVVVHALSVSVLFFPFARLTGSSTVTWIALALFAVSPLRLESVLWVSERKDVLSFFFLSLTIYFYERSFHGLSAAHKWLGVFCASLGLLSKPSIVTIPILLVCIDLIRAEERPSPFQILRWIGEKWIYWLLAFGASLAAMVGQSAAGGLKSAAQLPLANRVANAGIGYLAYVGKLFWPFDLAVFYPLEQLPSGIGAGGIVLVLIVTALMLRWVATEWTLASRFAISAWTWFLVACLPIIGLIQVGWQQYADRWTYIPHLLPTLAVCFAFSKFLSRFVATRWVGSVILLSCVGLESHQRAPMWLHSEMLFNHTLSMTDRNFFILTNLGVVRERRGDSAGAMEAYREALRFNPSYPLALNNFGVVLAKEHRFTDALVQFRKALDSNPRFLPAKFHLGLSLLRLNEPWKALREWSELLRSAPHHTEARDMVLSTVNSLATNGCRDGAGGEEVSSVIADLRAILGDAELDGLRQGGCL